MTTTSGTATFTATGVVMDYGATRALAGVDLRLERGQVHGLLGANGAGKSTLIKIVAGLTTPTGGRIELDGEPYAPRSPRDAMRAGIRVAHQELAVVPALSVRQNLALGERFRPGASEKAYRELFDEWEIDVPLSAEMRSLAPALQTAVSLARSLAGDARLVLLDEPTASLGPHEVAGLFRIVRRRAAEGAAVVFVSHRLGEVSELCTDATVLRNGVVVSSGPTEGLDEHQLAQLIAPSVPNDAKPADDAARPPAGTGGPVAGGRTAARLEVRGLRLQTAVAGVELRIAPGEVVGLAGLVGAGRTEVVEALMGLRRIVGGTVTLDGAPYRPRNAADAVRRGVALVPEERAAHALFPARDIVFNASSSRFRRLGRGPGGWLSAPRAYERVAAEVTGDLKLKAASLKDPITSLSGGNQQKVVLARVLTDGLRLLLLDEPTRGVDVGARRDFQALVRRVADRGVGVLYISSELAELAFCDRIQVIVEGRTTVSAPVGPDFDEDELTRLCFLRHVPGDRS
ncbi:sugar ABC transporter ATP-binding protein [Cryptosporangium japonicum]|uniref:Sugar ABC transporter ATP-binding protein n=1 Tax=Cryptosporangium japonicum TaxID=80872 RepID=A0ABP3EPF3_9ACTN